MLDVLDGESSLPGIRGIVRRDVLIANGRRPAEVVGDSNLYSISRPEDAMPALSIIFRYTALR